MERIPVASQGLLNVTTTILNNDKPRGWEDYYLSSTTNV
jgi:hypothetical protein